MVLSEFPVTKQRYSNPIWWLAKRLADEEASFVWWRLTEAEQNAWYDKVLNG